MKIFKFGGGIIKDHHSIKQLGDILLDFKGDKLLIVLSAMDKTTNNLENLISDYYHNKTNFNNAFDAIYHFHFNVVENLDLQSKPGLKQELDAQFMMLKRHFEDFHAYPYEVFYDQIVSFGEVLSSIIVYYYLLEIGLNTSWIDARKYILTSHHHRSASIDEDATRNGITDVIKKSKQIIVTQGFIGYSKHQLVTTLGREGSDYTASMLGAILKAEKVIIWKDVNGIFNADPKFYPQAKRIDCMSYDQAAELTGLGAKVLHHRTIQPVKKYSIPMEVRQFGKRSPSGTIIADLKGIDFNLPVIVHRKNKILFIIKPLNHHKIGEREVSDIIKLLDDLHLETNYISYDQKQLTLCLNHLIEPVLGLKDALDKLFTIEIIFGVMMLKVKNGNKEVLQTLKSGKTILYEGMQDGVNYIFY